MKSLTDLAVKHRDKGCIFCNAGMKGATALSALSVRYIGGTKEVKNGYTICAYHNGMMMNNWNGKAAEMQMMARGYLKGLMLAGR